MMEHISIGTQIQDLVNMIGAARSITFFSQNKRAGGGFTLSGGTETTVGSDKVLTFTTNGTLTVNGSGTIQILVVGGGQNGENGVSSFGSWRGGAGGSGGAVNYIASHTVTSGSYNIVVGDVNQTSSALGYSAAGGAGAAGGAARIDVYASGFNGTNGTSNSITGTSVVYGSGAGGGAASYNGNPSALSGGSGGTGAGNGGGTTAGVPTNPTSSSAGTNYGAGGGGGAGVRNTSNSGTGSAGVQGVVIIRYTPN